jgi:hypothetical protein
MQIGCLFCWFHLCHSLFPISPAIPNVCLVRCMSQMPKAPKPLLYIAITNSVELIHSQLTSRKEISVLMAFFHFSTWKEKKIITGNQRQKKIPPPKFPIEISDDHPPAMTLPHSGAFNAVLTQLLTLLNNRKPPLPLPGDIEIQIQ